MTTGYAHGQYATSLADFGRPHGLPRSGGWILVRNIPGTDARDAMGPYPLFACNDWAQLGADLEEIGSDLVSIVLVADPFGNHQPDLLARAFNRGAAPFKDHHVVDVRSPLEATVSAHHRRNVRKALRFVTAECVENPIAALDDWTRLYGTLIERHAIDGIRAFSRASFASQLATPGLMAYRAVVATETVGMLLFYVQGDVAYYHLGAFSPRGYELGAAFAVFWTALKELSCTVKFVSLGGDAGVDNDEGGLARFKRGWANTTRCAYVCRHVGNPELYARLSSGRSETSFFPAYRAGEFAQRSPGDGATL